MNDDIHIAYQELQDVKSHVDTACTVARVQLDKLREQQGDDTIEYTHARVNMLYLEAALHAVENALAAVSDACGDVAYVKSPTSKKDPRDI